jgi:hypothetical protein
MFGLPTAGAPELQATPLDVVKGFFRDMKGWVNKEPEDDFTPDEFAAFASIGLELEQTGDVGRAVQQLRALRTAQWSRRSKGFKGFGRRVRAMLQRRRHVTEIDRLLAMLLNRLATERANSALETFGREVEGFKQRRDDAQRAFIEQMERLKQKADASQPLTMDRIVELLKAQSRA